MIKVYCELGAMRKELIQLRIDGLIQLIHFPYEGHSKKMAITQIPSLVTADMTYVTCDSTIRIGDCEPSNMYKSIKMIIGHHEFDARHIDAAYKNKCHCFLSRDKGDIVTHSQALEKLLGVKFLHPDEDWEYFLGMAHENA